eukprot:jgi/Ulvmu1/12766/UM096_0008.1
MSVCDIECVQLLKSSEMMSLAQRLTKLRLFIRRRISKTSPGKLKVAAVVWVCVLVWVFVSFISATRRHHAHLKSKSDAGRSPLKQKRAPVQQHTPVVDDSVQTSSFMMPSTGSTVGALGAVCFTDKCDGSAVDSSSINTTILIGILSDPVDDLDFRAAARATWVKTAMAMDQVRVVFFFPSKYEAVRQEAAQHNDIEFGTKSDSHMPAAYQMLEHFAQANDALHILRVHVRSYVSVPRLLAKLEHVCVASKCRGEDIWAGRQITHKEITNDRRYQEQTGLSSYLPYMSSGAYVISMSLAAALSLMHNDIGLKYYGSEDVSLGLWLIPMAARRIDLGNAIQLEKPCCFDSWGIMKVDICAEQAEQLPIVLSVLEKPQYLQRYHDAIRECCR